jgi:hypothetical protein
MNDTSPPADLRARVLDAVGRVPALSRDVGARRRAVVVARGVAVAAAVGVAAAIHGPEARGRPVEYVATLEVLWLLLAVLVTWVAVARGPSMLGRPVSWKLTVAVLTPAALLLAWLPVALAWPHTLHDASGLRSHGVCVAMTFAFAAGPLVAFARLHRASDPLNPRVTGAALGAAAGAWGAVAHGLICGYTSPVHMALGHILPVALLALVGVLVGERVVALSAETVSREIRC